MKNYVNKYMKKSIDKVENLCRKINQPYLRDGDFAIAVMNHNYTENAPVLFRVKSDACMSGAGLFEFSSDVLKIAPCWLRLSDIIRIITGACQ